MRLKLLFFPLLAMALALNFIACKGDLGPVGPAGPKGDKGETGSTGQPGEQGWGTQDCAKCHTSQIIAVKQFQWEHSGHALGGHYNHNQASCAPCHTSQGFLEVVANGGQATAATVTDPLPQNCYACHKIHSSFTEADWALTQTNPVTFWVGGETVDLGNSNLCVSCHQTRPSNPPLPNPATGGEVALTAAQALRYGPHHGAQGVMFTGNSGYELDFGTPYQNSAHTKLVKDACITCHMATANGTGSGGHTFNVADATTGAINTAGCVACHSTPADLNASIVSTQTEIANLLQTLKSKLVEKGLMNENTDAAVARTYTGHELGAFYNYKYVSEDNSFGVHNYKYAKALLQNSIAALQ